MRLNFVVALLLAFGMLTWATSMDASPGPLAGKRVLVHLKTGFQQDDNQPCVAFDVAFAALKQRRKSGDVV